MGTTLTNGVYLPNEGERNCYAGLKTNWEILDQKVADVTALQQAVAGALHREIVESLPTTDINPNTIYMILSGTSATENVYNEFMYVNNAWELIGTSATDLTNYYTKAEVDGKLLLKANASDLTSHTGDTTIHVTASDKTKWTNSANTVVLRLAKTALTPSSSTNAFSNLDDATALKVGDKVMDTAGVLFEVTAIDTANSTFTIGTSLIDLANDSDVVHKSGNETVAGQKTFSDTATFVSINVEDIRWKNLTNQTVDLNDCYIPRAGAISGYYVNSVSAGANISNKATNTAFTMISLTTRRISASDYHVRQVFYGSGAKYIRTCANGTWTAWVNEVDKYVTTDTTQTISGVKTFTKVLTNNLQAENSSLILQSSGTNRNCAMFNGSSAADGGGFWCYGKDSSTGSDCRIQIYNTSKSRFERVDLVNSQFLPTPSGELGCGGSSNKWKSFNGLNPGSLSLPLYASKIDISSYITDLTGVNNEYTPTVNGWICVRSGNATKISILDSKTSIGNQSVSSTATYLTVMTPVVANRKVYLNVVCTSLSHAYFIPCQGNV